MQVTVKPLVSYKGDGQNKVFSIPFDYLRKAFITVTLNGELTFEYTIEQRTLTFYAAPALDVKIEITRNTSSTRLVSWADASVLRARDMNINDIQSLHLIEEQQLWAERNSVVLNSEGHWDMRHHRVINVLDPVNDQDAVTKKSMTVAMDKVKQDITVENKKLADFIKEQADIAVKAALINCRYPISELVVRDPALPTYGLTNATIIVNVPQLLHLEVIGDSNPKGVI